MHSRLPRLIDRELCFNTDALDLRHRIDAYKDLYSAGADVEILGAAFRAAMRMRRVSPFVLYRRELRDVAHRRDPERVRRDAFDHFTLHLSVHGSIRVDADGRRNIVAPGEIVMLDMTRPMRTAAEGEIVTCSLPRDLVARRRPGAAELHGLVIPAWRAAGLSRWMLELWSRPDDAPGQPQDAEDFMALLSEALAENPSACQARRDRVVLRRDHIRSILELNLQNANLTPERVASEAGLSRATVYRVFEPLGTLSGWRQGRRLWRMRQELASGATSIADAAMAAGFEDPSYASAVFFQAVGVTPSRYRRELEQIRRSGDPDSALRWVMSNVPVILSTHVD